MLLFPEHEARAALRAMSAVAAAHAPVEPIEQRWIDAVARTLGLDPAVEDLSPCSPELVAAHVTDTRSRERVVQAMILMAILDGEATADEVSLVRQFASALGVDEPRLASLDQLARGRALAMWVGLARRSFARRTFEQALREEGLGGVWRIVGPMIGLARDYALVRRYNDLGQLPEGTLGRAYWDFIVKNDLRFPGEPGAVAERGLWHDMSHVLSGYGVDPEGEVSVVSFIAGYRRDDPFFWLFTIALQFHVGLRVSPYSEGHRGRFQPEIVLKALARGAAMKTDISEGWDPWPLMDRPLVEVRETLGVPA
jgi:tellurite resistance protein